MHELILSVTIPSGQSQGISNSVSLDYSYHRKTFPRIDYHYYDDHSKSLAYIIQLSNSWFATTWQGGHVGGQNKRNFSAKFVLK